MTIAERTEPASRPAGLSRAELDALLDSHIESALATLNGPAALLSGMARFHFGMADEHLRPIPPKARVQGKRMRPRIAILCCLAAGGDTEVAAPLGAAIELLHNFTLVHDDIQDRSEQRHHRPTVWSRWGEGQAINTGDAVFATAHLALFQLGEAGVPDGLILRLAEAFDQMTIEIVAGQVLDLGFEGRADVTADDYLTMIAGKTAAIVRYAAWAGALLGAADDAHAERFAAFGHALGIGFQIRDDVLGIWGSPEATGKAATDDIRQRKQSLPVVILRERAGDADRHELDALYSQAAIDQDGIDRVLTLLARYDVRTAVEARIAAYHDDARFALDAAAGEGANAAHDALLDLVESLASRSG
ncbi:MAG: polyprenyl synthetase family protein [Thermomicrobiales bacterium]